MDIPFIISFLDNRSKSAKFERLKLLGGGHGNKRSAVIKLAQESPQAAEAVIEKYEGRGLEFKKNVLNLIAEGGEAVARALQFQSLAVSTLGDWNQQSLESKLLETIIAVEHNAGPDLVAALSWEFRECCRSGSPRRYNERHGVIGDLAVALYLSSAEGRQYIVGAMSQSAYPRGRGGIPMDLPIGGTELACALKALLKHFNGKTEELRPLLIKFAFGGLDDREHGFGGVIQASRIGVGEWLNRIKVAVTAGSLELPATGVDLLIETFEGQEPQVFRLIEREADVRQLIKVKDGMELALDLHAAVIRVAEQFGYVSAEEFKQQSRDDEVTNYFPRLGQTINQTETLVAIANLKDRKLSTVKRRSPGATQVA